MVGLHPCVGGGWTELNDNHIFGGPVYIECCVDKTINHFHGTESPERKNPKSGAHVNLRYCGRAGSINSFVLRVIMTIWKLYDCN